MNASREFEYEKFKTRGAKCEAQKRVPFVQGFFGRRVALGFWISDFGFGNCPQMKLGTVIGRVTLSKTVPALAGGRFLIVAPFGREQYARGLHAPLTFSKDFAPVVYDALGGGLGQVIGYVEGREAAQPFDQPTPVDAINAALVDQIFYRPWPG